MGMPFNEVVAQPIDINLLYSSHTIANMLLVDAISGIIKGKFWYFLAKKHEIIKISLIQMNV